MDLKRLARILKVTQAGLADILGVSPAHVSMVIHGKRKTSKLLDRMIWKIFEEHSKKEIDNT